jgi:DNA-binding response OmpR family regulator
VNVLVAEDDRITARVLDKQLRATGLDVKVVHGGDDAWLALDCEAPPLVAVLDWTMPNLSGPEVCRRVRARPGAPYTYLLLLTGRDQTTDVTAGLDAGADDYVKKPFEIADLVQRVKHGMDVARARRAAPA